MIRKINPRKALGIENQHMNHVNNINNKLHIIIIDLRRRRRRVERAPPNLKTNTRIVLITNDQIQ